MHLSEPIFPAAYFGNQAGLFLRILLLVTLLLIAPFLAGCRHARCARARPLCRRSRQRRDHALQQQPARRQNSQRLHLRWRRPISIAHVECPAGRHQNPRSHRNRSRCGGRHLYPLGALQPAGKHQRTPSQCLEAGTTGRRLTAGTQRLRQDRLRRLLPPHGTTIVTSSISSRSTQI